MRIVFILYSIMIMAGGIFPAVAFAQGDDRGIVSDPLNDDTVDALGVILRSQTEDNVVVTDDNALVHDDADMPDDVRLDPDFLSDEGKNYIDHASVTVRILDKITAESHSFDLAVGKTVKFGSIRIRPMTCKETSPIDEPESASFLQIWEELPSGDNEWIFSGWMFASSPSLSAMDHPVYDVWVLDCKE